MTVAVLSKRLTAEKTWSKQDRWKQECRKQESVESKILFDRYIPVDEVKTRMYTFTESFPFNLQRITVQLYSKKRAYGGVF